jgi:CRISPR/Cas system CMR-associated protein Cmr1 (group 7 of RAMP superfamily)
MGKARVTQSTIDKAQDRVDRETDNYNKTKADMAKTLLAGDIQERLARASYSTKMTDFDKQWALYSKDAKARGEPATLDGFRRALEGTRSVVTEKEATRMAVDSLKNSSLDLSTPEGRQEFERQKRFFMQQGGGTKASSAGPTPALPAGFVLQP